MSADDKPIFYGDHCDVCQVTNTNLAHGRLPNGDMTARCEKHFEGMSCIEAISLCVEAPSVLKKAKASGALPKGPMKWHARDDSPDIDRDWFAAHPQRTHRIRPPTEAEKFGDLKLKDLDLDVSAMIVVRQIEPGIRVRVAFNEDAWAYFIALAPADRPWDDDDYLHRVFDVITNNKDGLLPVVSSFEELEEQDRFPASNV